MGIDKKLLVLEEVSGLHIGLGVRHCALPTSDVPLTISS
jgi:hypothetical protein